MMIIIIRVICFDFGFKINSDLEIPNRLYLQGKVAVAKLMLSNTNMFKQPLKKPWMNFALICGNNFGIGIMT